ncbi:MAG: aspartate carbamoyltransferase catalytic subunit [Dehalococcoidia bacterium]
MTTGIPTETPAVATGLESRRHVLDLDDFSPDEITSVLDATDAMREVLGRDIKKVPSLRGKVVLTLFLEASTRTRVSFEQAGKMLSADVINIAGSGTSAEKGESLLNTALTLQAMRADLLIVRHPHSGAPYFLARNLSSMGVINAGDGRHAHPTQALLDLYTMRHHLGSLEGARVVIVGDVLHSRVARSDIFGLAAMGASVVLSGPPTMMPLDMLKPGGAPGFPKVTVEPDLDKAVVDADVVMALRIQTERSSSGLLPSMREYTRRWQITPARMAAAKPGALVMHPGPMNEGLEITSSLAHGASALIEEQVTNGVAVRMAVLYQMLTGQGGPEQTGGTPA